MRRKGIIKGIGLVLMGSLISLNNSIARAETSSRAMNQEEIAGKKYFEGSNKFMNNGPSCISCHSVKNNQLISGGLFAKDLTDVYSRLGEGLSAWLAAPPFPAMASSYQNHPLTENERGKLQAFFKYANEVQATQKAKPGYDMMLIGGGAGLVIMLLVINFMWFKRKKKMVKREIFDRQSKAWDAKF